MRSDTKHPHCVSIQPGPCSERQKAFVVALNSEEEERAFLRVVNQYIAIAKQNPPLEDEE